MRKSHLHIIYILSIVLLCASCNQYHWQFTLQQGQKNPYDTYIAHQLLPSFFSKAVIQSNPEVFTKSYVDYPNQELKIIIVKTLDLSEQENESLVHYLNEGGTIFISADEMNFDLAYKLNIQINEGSDKWNVDNSSILKDTIITNINIDTVQQSYTLWDNSIYNFKGNFSGGNIMSCDKRLPIDSLGYDKSGRVNFMGIRVGKGKLYLHCAPVTFTNYFLVQQQNNKEYLSTIYSLFDKDTKEIYWYSGVSHMGNDNESDGNSNNFHLSVLFRYPMLKYAFLLLFGGIIAYILFNSKRKQRAIPIIPPVKNTTVEFVETLGNLYYNMNNHKNLAQKMINHFWEFIRTKYNLVKTENEPEFNRKLSMKTGVEKSNIEELMGWFVMILSSETIDEKNLETFYNKLQYFYNNAK